LLNWSAMVQSRSSSPEGHCHCSSAADHLIRVREWVKPILTNSGKSLQRQILVLIRNFNSLTSAKRELSQDEDSQQDFQRVTWNDFLIQVLNGPNR